MNGSGKPKCTAAWSPPPPPAGSKLPEFKKGTLVPQRHCLAATRVHSATLYGPPTTNWHLTRVYEEVVQAGGVVGAVRRQRHAQQPPAGLVYGSLTVLAPRHDLRGHRAQVQVGCVHPRCGGTEVRRAWQATALYGEVQIESSAAVKPVCK